jgi:hypothetical protein
MATDTTTARSVTITIPMAPPAALAPNRRGSEHWRYRQQAALELRTAAYVSVVHDFQGLPETIASVVTVHEHIVWPKGRRLVDPDSITGYCKAALDGIVDAGIISGDGPQHIKAPVLGTQEKGDDAQGSIVITIKEVQ